MSLNANQVRAYEQQTCVSCPMPRLYVDRCFKTMQTQTIENAMPPFDKASKNAYQMRFETISYRNTPLYSPSTFPFFSSPPPPLLLPLGPLASLNPSVLSA